MQSGETAGMEAAAPGNASSSSQPATPTRTPKPRTEAQAASAAPAETAHAQSAIRPQVSPEMRRAMIAESAYLRAEKRGFAPGGEVEDWCEAEKEVDAFLNAETHAAAQ
ncbi:MAG: DUF2934 domain-containing protein [Steroidobacteraceae bacterium]|nr:DUF2934 domain-containing protein [Steroidobacteraceae bacterium]